MRHDELTRARCKQEYIQSRQFDTKKAVIAYVAKRQKVPVPTLVRWEKAGGWEALRRAGVLGAPEIGETLFEPVQQGDRIEYRPINTDELLEKGIQSLSADLESVAAKSKEGVASALAKMIDLYNKRNPRTMLEFVNILLQLPDFDAWEFSKLLKQELDRRAAG